MKKRRITAIVIGIVVLGAISVSTISKWGAEDTVRPHTNTGNPQAPANAKVKATIPPLSSGLSNSIEIIDKLDVLHAKSERVGEIMLEMESQHAGFGALYSELLADLEDGAEATVVYELIDVGLEFVYPRWKALLPTGRIDEAAVNQAYAWSLKMLDDLDALSTLDSASLELNRFRVLSYVRNMERLWGELLPEVGAFDSNLAIWEYENLSGVEAYDTVTEATKKYLMHVTQESLLGNTNDMSHFDQLNLLEHPEDLSGRDYLTTTRIEIFRLIRQAHYLKQHPRLLDHRLENYHKAQELIFDLNKEELGSLNLADKLFLERTGLVILDELETIEKSK